MKTTIKVKFTDGTTDVYYHDDDWAERTRPELFGQPRLSERQPGTVSRL